MERDAGWVQSDLDGVMEQGLRRECLLRLDKPPLMYITCRLLQVACLNIRPSSCNPHMSHGKLFDGLHDK